MAEEQAVAGGYNPTKRFKRDVSLHELMGSPTFADSTEDIDWTAVTERCRSHPEEAAREFESPDRIVDTKLLDSREYTAFSVLHWACAEPDVTIEAVNAIVDAFPPALELRGKSTDYIGETADLRPLGMACMCGAASEVIRLLLRRHLGLLKGRDASNHFRWYNPIDFIVDEDLEAETARLLLEEYPEGALRGDKFSNWSPIDSIISTCGKTGYIRRRTWEILQILLSSAASVKYGDSPNKSERFSPLSTLIDAFCAPDGGIEDNWGHCLKVTLEEVRDRDPSQFSEIDHLGRLPLHTLLSYTWYDDSWDGNSDSIVEMFLDVHPHAARTRGHESDVPLHMAIQNRWPYHSILSMAPEALNTRSLKTGLYPYELAFIGEDTKDSHFFLNAKYDMLQRDPSIVGRLNA